MKKTVIITISFLSLLCCISCTQDEIETFKEADNIYFSPAIFPYIQVGSGARVPADSTGFSFAFDGPEITERQFLVPFRVQGNLSKEDRDVKVTVDSTSTAVEDIDFRLPENIVLHAGKEVDTLVVSVIRTPKLKTEELTLVLNLEDNNYFGTKMKSRVIDVLTQKTISSVRFKISFSDQLSKPAGWFDGILGYFTEKKFYLTVGLLKLSPEKFTIGLGKPGSFSSGELTSYKVFMKRYLADQKATGNTIYEEDGTEMFFP